MEVSIKVFEVYAIDRGRNNKEEYDMYKRMNLKFQLLSGICIPSNICLNSIICTKVDTIMCVCCHFSHVCLFVTLWGVAYQVLCPRGLSRQEYWSEFPFLSPRDLPSPGINPPSLSCPHWQVDSLPLAPSVVLV